jgi:glycosyltransferase involved in cell wall biosynthesis
MNFRLSGAQTLIDTVLGSGTDYRSAGDKARSRGDWTEAAVNYKAYLERNPKDFDIWVQLGHANKETGAYSSAREAYSMAIDLRPNDFDVYLNKGHLEKLAGRRDAAITAYKRAYELNPDNGDALREIVALEGDLSEFATPEATAATKTIYLDMTDLIVYVQTNVSLSGIQRVVANLIEGISAFNKQHPDVAVVPVIPEYDKNRVFSVNRHLVLAMIESIQHGRSGIKKAVEAVYASRVLVRPTRGDIFTIAGAFWIYPHYDMVQRLRESGVKFVIFIHDLIQISHPEYVHKEATLVFRRALIDVLKLANGVLTNTEFVASEVRQFMKENCNFEIPVKSVFLSTELVKPIKGAVGLNGRICEVLQEPYVLSVSTLEVRKNHMYMIKIWERLIANNVRDIPNLVFVGKIGWDIQPLADYLNTSDQLGGRLRVLQDITDQELAELYKGSMFTMFPSFVEGFGLPVGESLAYGKPVISSDRSSMPEVGGKFARYVDPEDVKEGYKLVLDLLTHPHELAKWTAEVAAGYKPKSWQQFALEYLNATMTVGKSADAPLNGYFEPGDIIGMGASEIDRRRELDLPLTYLAFARRSGWHAVETWGCWTATRNATLRLPTKLGAGKDVYVYLAVQTPGHTDPETASLRVDVGGRIIVFKRLQPRRRWLAAKGKTDADGVLSISLQSAGPFDKPEQREVYIGLFALGFCAVDDLPSRLEMLEKIVLDQAV